MDQRTKCVSPHPAANHFFYQGEYQLSEKHIQQPDYPSCCHSAQRTALVSPPRCKSYPVMGRVRLLDVALRAPCADHRYMVSRCQLPFSPLAVFILAALNNANMLLRVGSRMLSSILAIQACLLLSFHALHPGHVLIVLSLLAFFPLMSSYQRPSPQLAFATFLLLSLSSLVFPKMLWSAPLYWIMLSMLRAMSTRCLLASVLALLIPYWLTGGVALYDGDWNSYIALLKSIIDFSSCDYGSVPVTTIVPFAYFVLLFAIGSIDFYINRYKDKTRTRMYLHAILVHGCYYTIFIALQPQHSLVLMPLLLISSSIMYGHYFTLTQTKQSHVLNIVLLVMGVAVIVFQYDIPIAQYADTTLSTIQQWIHSISFL